MRRVAHSTGLGGSISANDIVKETRVVDQINVSTPLNLAFNVDSVPLLRIRADAGSTVIKLTCYQYDLEADNISVDGSTLTISGWNQTVYGIPASAFNGTHTIIRGEATNYYDPPEYQHTDEVVFDIRVFNNLPHGTHKSDWLNTTSSFHVADRGFTTPVTCTWSISKVNTFTNKLPTHDAIVNHVSTAISTALTNYTGNSAANVTFASVTTDYIRLDPVSIADGNSTFDGLGVKNSNGTTLKPIIVSDVYITDRGVWVSASLDNKLDTPAGTPSINDVMIYNGGSWSFEQLIFTYDSTTSTVVLNPTFTPPVTSLEVPKIKFTDTSMAINTFRKFKTTKDEILADSENSPISCQSYTDCAANAVFASSHVNGYHLLSPSASNIHAHLTANYMPLITGGSNGDVLTTDGAGNLSFSTPSSATSSGSNWHLVTWMRRSPATPMNNPWTGEGQSGSPPVLIPLETLSTNAHGTDLTIKIELVMDRPATNTSYPDHIYTWFFTGWYLDEIFDYSHGNISTTTDGSTYTASVKRNWTDAWTTASMTTKYYADWNWPFAAMASHAFDYTTLLGLLVHGASGSETSAYIYNGMETTASNVVPVPGWKYLRVYYYQ